MLVSCLVGWQRCLFQSVFLLQPGSTVLPQIRHWKQTQTLLYWKARHEHCTGAAPRVQRLSSAGPFPSGCFLSSCRIILSSPLPCPALPAWPWHASLTPTKLPSMRHHPSTSYVHRQVSSDGHVLGSLGIMDVKPRSFPAGACLRYVVCGTGSVHHAMRYSTCTPHDAASCTDAACLPVSPASHTAPPDTCMLARSHPHDCTQTSTTQYLPSNTHTYTHCTQRLHGSHRQLNNFYITHSHAHAPSHTFIHTSIHLISAPPQVLSTSSATLPSWW